MNVAAACMAGITILALVIALRALLMWAVLRADKRQWKRMQPSPAQEKRVWVNQVDEE